MRCVKFIIDRPPFCAGDEVFIDDRLAEEVARAGAATFDLEAPLLHAAPVSDGGDEAVLAEE